MKNKTTNQYSLVHPEGHSMVFMTQRSKIGDKFVTATYLSMGLGGPGAARLVVSIPHKGGQAKIHFQSRVPVKLETETSRYVWRAMVFDGWNRLDT